MKSTFYSRNPDEGIICHDTAEEAQADAQRFLDLCTMVAPAEGWPEGVKDVEWGALVPVERAGTSAASPSDYTLIPVSGGDGLDTAPIRARLEAATRGPWPANLQGIIRHRGLRSVYVATADATFIANAPTDITALLAENERLKAEIVRLGGAP